MKIKEKNIKEVYGILYEYLKNIYNEKALRILGEEEEFKEKIKEIPIPNTSEESTEESIILELGTLEIKFPSIFFKKLFYECEVGDITSIGHIEFEGKIYVEYKDAISFEISYLSDIIYENPIDGITIFIDPSGKSYLDYEELYDYYIYTLKLRKYPEVIVPKETYKISDFLRPIHYITIIDLEKLNQNEGILQSLNFYLAKYLGISPIKIDNLLETSSFILDQNIGRRKLLERIKSFNAIKAKGTQAINYYLKALNEPDPLYQFLDFYHIIETFCYDYIWDYYTKLDKEPREKFKELIKLEKEEEIIKKVFVILQKSYKEKFENFRRNLDKIEEELEEFLTKLNKNISGNILPKYRNWGTQNEEYFGNFGRFIFKIRSEIAHRKIQRNPITSYAKMHHKVISEINEIMKEIAEIIIENREILKKQS